VTIFVIAVGLVTAGYGIVSGNVAANRMWDEMKEKEKSDLGMFSDAQIMAPVSLQGPRSDAVSNYRRLHPNDSKVRKLRNGQILTLVGCAVMFLGFFI
jgi:hypothetical protein